MKEKLEGLSKDVLSKDMEKLHKEDKHIKALSEHLKKQGFEPQTGEKNYWGIKNTYEDQDKKVDFSIKLQDYHKRDKKSKDGAAIAQVQVAAGDQVETYSFSLIAPDGDYKKTIEHKVDKDLKVVKAESWWDCVLAEMTRKIGNILAGILSDCVIKALLTGPWSWATFLGCVALKVGGPFAMASACCGCNCSPWCSWLVGCCHS